jgi:hypothetical protein
VDDGGPFLKELAGAGRSRLAELVSEAAARGAVDEATGLRILRHPFCSEETIRLVLLSRVAMSAASVRKAVALHPATPRADALRSVEDLGWRDLADIGRSARTPPPVRRAASRRVAERLVRLSKGERVSLARLADRELLAALLHDADPDVVSAVLRNPRLVAGDVVAWASRAPHPRSIAAVATDGKWRRRADVRAALLRARGAPGGAVIDLLRASTPRELRELVVEPGVPPLTAAWAERLLAEAGEGAGAPSIRSVHPVSRNR